MLDSARIQQPADLSAVLRSLHKRGVRLWHENGRLHYQAPRGTLTSEDVQTVRHLKHQILAVLERSSAIAPVSRARRPTDEPFRLTHSQLSHWHLYNLGARRHVRQIASATRLSGELDFEVLKDSLKALVRRHDALRIRISLEDGTPMQTISEAASFALATEDLSGLSENSRERALKQLIEHHVLEPINVIVDPLIAARVVRLCAGEHVLVLALEHLIADGVSINILLRDLFSIYRALSTDTVVQLPEIPVQFADYAIWQRTAQEQRIGEHVRYWKSRLTGCGRVRFPDNNIANTVERSGWGIVPITIDSALTADLLEWSRRRGTTLVMSILTAYGSLVLRWCNAREIVIRYVFDGRATPGLENSIGYFAFMLFLRLQLDPSDTFADVQRKLTEEYCSAHEHPTFGCIESEVPLPDFVRGCGFNWIPRGGESALCESCPSGDSIKCLPVRFEHPLIKRLDRDSEPFVQLYDRGGEIAGGVFFPLSRFSRITMETFAAHLQRIMRVQSKDPDSIVSKIVFS